MIDTLPEHLDDVYNWVPGRTVPSLQRAGTMGFARLTACSIAGRGAASWVTAFLSAAYYRRDADRRDVDDLRLAFCILITYWHRHVRDRQLHLTDVPAFQRAFGRDFTHADEALAGALDGSRLASGAERLLGADFLDGYADDARRAWGIVFETSDEREGYDPAQRMQLANPGPLTPAQRPEDEQAWRAYPPVEMPSAQTAAARLGAPETWPDYASEIARFTPLKAGGLADQTFEIDLAARTQDGQPMFTRGYATITRVHTRDDTAQLDAWIANLADGVSGFVGEQTLVVPRGSVPLLGFDLTTHQGHFLGSGHTQVILYTHQDQSWARAIGTWDPPIRQDLEASRLIGQHAHHAFWGEGSDPRKSMLHQLARSPRI